MRILTPIQIIGKFAQGHLTKHVSEVDSVMSAINKQLLVRFDRLCEEESVTMSFNCSMAAVVEVVLVLRTQGWKANWGRCEEKAFIRIGIENRRSDGL